LRRRDQAASSFLVVDLARDSWRDRAPRVTKLFELRYRYCTSLGAFEPPAVDLGAVGYDNAWQSVPVAVALRNAASVPLYCELPALPPFLRLVSTATAPTADAAGHAGPPGADVAVAADRRDAAFALLTAPPEPPWLPETGATGGAAAAAAAASDAAAPPVRFVVPPRDALPLQLELAPAVLYATVTDGERASFNGPWTFDLKATNLGNPKAPLVLRLTAHIGTYELRLARLGEGERVLLPPITYPPPATGLISDPWFTVDNVADRSVAFEVGDP